MWNLPYLGSLQLSIASKHNIILHCMAVTLLLQWTLSITACMIHIIKISNFTGLGQIIIISLSGYHLEILVWGGSRRGSFTCTHHALYFLLPLLSYYDTEVLRILIWYSVSLKVIKYMVAQKHTHFPPLSPFSLSPILFLSPSFWGEGGEAGCFGGEASPHLPHWMKPYLY